MVLCLLDGSKIKFAIPCGGFPSPKQPFFSVYKLFLGKAHTISDERFGLEKQAVDLSCISSMFPWRCGANTLDKKLVQIEKKQSDNGIPGKFHFPLPGILPLKS